MNKSSKKSSVKKNSRGLATKNSSTKKKTNYLPHTLLVIGGIMIPFLNQFSVLFMTLFPALTIILTIMSLQGSNVTTLFIIIYLIFLIIFFYEQTKPYKEAEAAGDKD